MIVKHKSTSISQSFNSTKVIFYFIFKCIEISCNWESLISIEIMKYFYRMFLFFEKNILTMLLLSSQSNKMNFIIKLKNNFSSEYVNGIITPMKPEYMNLMYHCRCSRFFCFFYTHFKARHFWVIWRLRKNNKIFLFITFFEKEKSIWSNSYFFINL
jgi:hypothetical protein